MLNISEAEKLIWYSSAVKKNLIITIPDKSIIITNQDIVSESFELVESIEDNSSLTFKGCIAAQMKFKVSTLVTDLRGQYIEAKICADGTSYIPLFKGYIDSQDNLSHEDIITEFICYDVLYQKGDIECADWYQGLTFPMSVKAFRDSFFNFIGITQKDTSLVNDSLSMVKTISVGTSLKSRYIMQSICQANARYGRIGRDGLFEYVKLPDIAITQGTYPSTETFPGENTFPGRPQQTQIITDSMYKDVEYDPYDVEPITKVVVWDETEITKGEAGDGTNILKIAGNVVAFSVDLNACARNIFGEVDDITCTSTRINLVGLPFVECGDVYKYNTRLNMINSYVFNRTLKGIQALYDNYSSNLDQYQSDDDSLSNQIIRLDGKTNKLTRTVDETRSELTSFERDTNNNLTQLSSTITQTAEAITSEVTRATKAEDDLSSSIKQTAEAITTKVSKGDISSEISQEAGKISIKSNRISITSDNFTLAKDGTITATNGTFSGKVTSSSGTIGGFTITDDAIYSGNYSSGTGVKLSVGGLSVIGGDRSVTITKTGGIYADFCNIAGFKMRAMNSANTEGAIYRGKESLDDDNRKGIYIGTDGINIGGTSGSFVYGFKVTVDGNIRLKPAGNGTFTIGSGAVFQNTGALSIGSFSVGASGILSVGSSAYDLGFYVTSNGRTVRVYEKIQVGGDSGSAISGTAVTVPANWALRSNKRDVIKSASSGSTLTVGLSITGSYVSIPSGTVNVGASSSFVTIGGSSSKIRFFDTTTYSSSGASKQTVTKLSSSATLANVISKLNDLLTALNKYNLIGV